MKVPYIICRPLLDNQREGSVMKWNWSGIKKTEHKINIWRNVMVKRKCSIVPWEDVLPLYSHFWHLFSFSYDKKSILKNKMIPTLFFSSLLEYTISLFCRISPFTCKRVKLKWILLEEPCTCCVIFMLIKFWRWE